jgi:hypothetical protein
MMPKLRIAAMAAAVLVLFLPDIAAAQAGRMHRATRRRTAVVVHSATKAADQQQQSQQPEAQQPEAQQTSTVAAQAATGEGATPAVHGGASATLVARAPPDTVRRTAGVGWQRDG